MSKQRITSKNQNIITLRTAWASFYIDRQERGNTAATMRYYNQFYSMYVDYLGNEDLPITLMEEQGAQLNFMKFLESREVNTQTINSYLRGYRAFGNYCLNTGYLSNFKCQIKEVEPPVKDVYTTSELNKLLIKPQIKDFEQFRNYTIISLILSTGVRSNTILNLKIKDVNLEEGYINFNTTKAHKVISIGLENKMYRLLGEYIRSWRSTNKDEYLFCNNYGEQLTRSGLTSAIKRYNQKRGVDKSSIHLFRHTFCKNWITSGGDLISLAKVLTHSELEMVKRYSNLYSSDLKDKIQQHSTLSQLRTRSGETLRTR